MDIDQAEKKIASVLKQLEQDQGALVDSLKLETVDTTNFTHARQQLRQRVRITLSRLPAHDWVD